MHPVFVRTVPEGVCIVADVELGVKEIDDTLIPDVATEHIRTLGEFIMVAHDQLDMSTHDLLFEETDPIAEGKIPDDDEPVIASHHRIDIVQ